MNKFDEESNFDENVRMALIDAHEEFRRFLVRRTASLQEAEDILQDFYLKVVQNAHTVRNPKALGGWLAQVLRRTLADYYRKSSVKQRLQQRLEEQTEVSMTRDEATSVVCTCLYRLLPALPPQYAQVIWRVDLLGQPRSQVAKRLGVSENNLSVRIHRARQALRAALEKYCITCPIHGFFNCGCEEAKKQASRGVMKKRRDRLNKGGTNKQTM